MSAPNGACKGEAFENEPVGPELLAILIVIAVGPPALPYWSFQVIFDDKVSPGDTPEPLIFVATVKFPLLAIAIVAFDEVNPCTAAPLYPVPP